MNVKCFLPILALLPAILWLTGCGNDDSQHQSQAQWERLEMLPFRDAQGTVLAELPFPPRWKVMNNRKPGEPTLVGPEGIKIVDFPGPNFTYPTDPRLQQSFRQAGQNMRAMPGIELLIQQDLIPWAQQRGLRFVRYDEVPEVSRIDQWYNQQLLKAVPMQMQIAAIGTEWETPAGEPYFLLMHLSVANSDTIQSWSYYCSGLQAAPRHFDTAKKQFLFALANARYNPEPILAYNQREAQKAGQSWAAHNERMARNQAAFAASQRDFVNRSTAAHDALMSNWRERNAASDRAHEQFVDTITERTKVVNPESGQQYKVTSGYNHYWMNANGEYLSTDRQDYNPNRDEAINNQNWQELQKAEY